MKATFGILLDGKQQRHKIKVFMRRKKSAGSLQNPLPDLSTRRVLPPVTVSSVAAALCFALPAGCCTHLAVNNTAGFITLLNCSFSHFLVRCRVFVFSCVQAYAFTEAHMHSLGNTHTHTHTHQILCRRLGPSLWRSFLWQ